MFHDAIRTSDRLLFLFILLLGFLFLQWSRYFVSLFTTQIECFGSYRQVTQFTAQLCLGTQSHADGHSMKHLNGVATRADCSHSGVQQSLHASREPTRWQARTHERLIYICRFQQSHRGDEALLQSAPAAG